MRGRRPSRGRGDEGAAQQTEESGSRSEAGAKLPSCVGSTIVDIFVTYSRTPPRVSEINSHSVFKCLLIIWCVGQIFPTEFGLYTKSGIVLVESHRADHAVSCCLLMAADAGHEVSTYWYAHFSYSASTAISVRHRKDTSCTTQILFAGPDHRRLRQFSSTANRSCQASRHLPCISGTQALTVHIPRPTNTDQPITGRAHFSSSTFLLMH